MYDDHRFLSKKKTASIQAQRKSIRKDFEALFPGISEAFPEHFPPEIFTFEEFKWAFSVYNSRVWLESKHTPTSILPLIEVFNYAHESSVRFLPTEEGILQVIATKDIDEGEEIFLSERRLSNRDLLKFFGFVLERNHAESFPVGVGLDKDDRLYGNKKETLHRRGLRNGQHYELSEKDIDPNLLFALRVYHVTLFDFDELENVFENKPVSLQNEKKVANTLIELCETTLRQYPTTAKKDKVLLKETLSSRHRNAVILRRGEKRILFKTLQRARSALGQVENQWDFRSIDILNEKALKNFVIPETGIEIM